MTDTTETSDGTPEAVGETAAAVVPPDRLAIDPTSPYFDADMLRAGIGVRFKGVEKFNVEEYCVSEGWIRVPAGKALDRRGRPLTIKLSGPVEVWVKG